MGHHIASFGLTEADPSIPWQARGSAEKELSERPGWVRRTIPVVNDGAPGTAVAMVRGELAVNHMLGGDEGFTVCLSGTGWRISSGGRVFARSADAMEVAEKMLAACSGWAACQLNDYTDAQRQIVIAAVDTVERRGGILLDRVYPR
jgi:hypothetical protein